MKNLAILGGAIVAGLLALSPVKAGVSTTAPALLHTDAGTAEVTKAHYKKRRKFKRRIRRHHRRYDNYYYYDNRPRYRRSWNHYHPGWGYHRHPRRGSFGLNFFF